jgi:hypothetical protein
MRINRTFKSLVTVCSAAAALLLNGMAWAQATKTPISFQVVSAVTTDPGESRVTGSVQHILGQELVVQLSGDITTSSTVVLDTHVNLKTGRGTVRGCFVSAQFEGCFSGQIDLATGIQSGHVLAQGVRGTEFEGQVFVGTFEGPVPGMVIQGIVTTPPGR